MRNLRRFARFKVYEWAAAGYSFDEIAAKLGADRSALARLIVEDKSVKDAFAAGRAAMKKEPARA